VATLLSGPIRSLTWSFQAFDPTYSPPTKTGVPLIEILPLKLLPSGLVTRGTPAIVE
jgi:hypothetical protein